MCLSRINNKNNNVRMNIMYNEIGTYTKYIVCFCFDVNRIKFTKCGHCFSFRYLRNKTCNIRNRHALGSHVLCKYTTIMSTTY